MTLDINTIITIGQKLINISAEAFAHYRQATAAAGADEKTLALLDEEYALRIEREKKIVEGE